jgi:hypothetical protein
VHPARDERRRRDGVVTHTFLLWFVVSFVEDIPVQWQFFCVGTSCLPYEQVCESDESNGTICSHEFEAPSISTQEFCTDVVWTLHVPGGPATNRQESAFASPTTSLCVDMEQIPGPAVELFPQI